METLHPGRPGQPQGLLRTRLLIGLSQGIAVSGLLFIDRAYGGPGTSSYLFSVALMVSLFLPALWLSGVGLLTIAQLRRWTCAALGIIFWLAAVDLWTMAGALEDETAFFIQTRFGQLLCGTGLVLYIAQVIVLAGARERRWLASRASYFSCALALGLQLLVSLLAVLMLVHGGLFLLERMGLRCGDLWPIAPILAMGFAGAMHLATPNASRRSAPGPAQH